MLRPLFASLLSIFFLLSLLSACGPAPSSEGTPSNGPQEPGKPGDPEDPEDPTPTDPPDGLTASTDRSDAVILEWRAPAGATALLVERDGEEIARLDPEEERFEDLEASSWQLVPATFETPEVDFETISLAWEGPRPVDGADHGYVVVALYDDDVRAASEEVLGKRPAPAIVELLLERDGAPIAELTDEEDSFVDEEAGPWSIEAHALSAVGALEGIQLEWTPPRVQDGALHSYAVVATLADGSRVSSEPVEARLRSPARTGFELLRDGERMGSWTEGADHFLDVEAEAGTIGEVHLVASQPGRVEAVELSWNLPERQDGREYEYVVIASFEGAAALPSEPAIASRPAPRIVSIELSRDGQLIAAPDPASTTYEDHEAAPAILPETRFEASQGVRADGVELSWDAYEPTIQPHTYRWIATLDDGETLEAAPTQGSRRAPSLLGWSLQTPGGIVELPPSTLQHFDTSAAGGELDMRSLTASRDRHDVVQLAWDSPTGSPGETEDYTLVRHLEGDLEQGFPASGFRAAPAAVGFAIFRDGAEIATLAGDARSFDDGGADAPAPIAFENVEVSRDHDHVEISWTVASASSGELHEYQVEAIPDLGASGQRATAQGRRHLERTSLWLERDGLELQAQPMSPYRDVDVERASISAPTLSASDDREEEIVLDWTIPEVEAARSYRYQLAATTSDGEVIRSDELEAATSLPSLRSFGIYRDGALYRQVDDPQLRQVALEAEPGTIGMSVSASQGTEDEGIELSWTVSATPGPEHRFSIVARYHPPGVSSEFSAEVVGRTSAPQPTKFDLLRFGDPIASLPGDARSFLDRDAPGGPTGPSQVFASKDRPDAVGVSWSAPPPTAPQVGYLLEMHHGEEVSRRTVFGSRKPLTLSHFRILRGEVEAGIAPADSLAFDDVGAGWRNALIYGLNASDGTREDGVELSWSALAPLGQEYDYWVEAVYQDGVAVRSDRSGFGFRTSPALLRYEVQRDGGAWRSVGTETTFLDTEAPAGALSGLATSITVDPILSGVELHREPVSWVPAGPSTYRVQAVYEYGPPTLSGEVEGRRQHVPGTLGLRWQRSIADSAEDFVDLPGGDEATLVDWDAPADEGRYYRLAVDLDGAPLERTAATRAVVPGYERVAANSYNTCAIQTDGTLVCVGSDIGGIDEPPPGRFVEVDMGSFHGCALRDDGQILCWGENPAGNAPPEPVPGPFTAVAAGQALSCGILAADGGISCWGATALIGVPVGSFDRLSLRSSILCALTPTDQAQCWGFIPPFFPGTYQQLALGDYFACALDLDGLPSCQGVSPEITIPPPGEFLSLADGGRFTCGIREDGQVRCWGELTIPSSPSPGTRFLQVSVGTNHACGVREDRKLECWGANTHGQVPTRD